MTNIKILLLVMYHFSLVHLIGADENGNLRGATIRDRGVQASTEEEIRQLQPTNSTEFQVLPSVGSYGMGGRRLEIHGKDDRRMFKDSSWPWRAVGRVETARSTCTGTLIGARLMLTAQHCIPRQPDGTVGWIKFTPAYYDGLEPFGSAYAEHVWWVHQIPKRDKLYPSEFAWDYAVVKLDRRIGDEVGYMGFKVYKTQWNGGNYWRHIGYGGDVKNGHRPLYHHTSPIYSVQPYSTSSGGDSLLLKHVIDSTKGHSVRKDMLLFPFSTQIRWCSRRICPSSSYRNRVDPFLASSQTRRMKICLSSSGLTLAAARPRLGLA